MEENLHNDDFEKFLQNQVKHHRMFPSDKIWRNINSNLHQDYKWPALTIAAFAFVAAIVAVSLYFSPGPNIFAVDNSSNKISGEGKETGASPLLSSLSGKGKVSFNNSQPQDDLNVAPDNINPDVTTTSLSTTSEVGSKEPALPTSNITEKIRKQFLDKENSSESILSGEGNASFKIQAPSEDVSLKYYSTVTEVVVETKENVEANNIAPKELQHNKVLAVTVKKVTKKSRLSYEVYITPSASYRKLKEDHATTKQQNTNVGGPVAINYVSDINEVVRHKPGTGMESGVLFGYNLSKKLKVKTGLQLNVRQYLIEAYQSPREVATIAVNSGRGIDSFITFSSYRIASGNETAELTNRYYQLSIPFGLDYEVAGNKDIQLNIAASLQPTYMVTRNAFLISTDFKNYIESPEMTRKWNLNANFETYLSIKSGDYKWQLGPQLRYQTLPTSLKKYPIKEYLIDYGLKIGVSKSIQ
jgi:hypothetical protein